MAGFKGALKQLEAVVGESDPSTPIPYFLKTSLPNINQAVSGDPNLGFPGGRLISLQGPESCGKTALATELMAEAQRRGGFSALADYEHAFHHGHATSLGLDCGQDAENWYYRKPSTAEEGFELIYKTMRNLRASELGITLPANTKANPTADAQFLRAAMARKDLTKMLPIAIMIDSIASMVQSEADIAYEDQNMKTKNMAKASFLSMELPRMCRDADITGSTIIALNQIRDNPGVMYGEKTTSPGGWAMKFYPSLRIVLRRVSKWFEEYSGDPSKPNHSDIIGDVVEMFVVKNKVARPFVKTRYIFRTAGPVGLDLAGTMLYNGKEAGVLGPVAGKTVILPDGTKTTFDKAWADCQTNPALTKAITDHVMSKTMPTVATADEVNAFVEADKSDPTSKE